jgi:asparagine synthase (glutamine-hydrolysing)
VRHFDEPFSDPSMIPSFAVFKLATADVMVVLNGDGADELFAGYRHFIAARTARMANWMGASAMPPLIASLSRALPVPADGRTPYQFLHRFLRVLAANDAERFLALTGDRLTLAKKSWLYGDRTPDCCIHDSASLFLNPADAQVLGPVGATSLRDFRLLLAAEHLVKMNMASMEATLEARSPFLDHELIEFIMRVPERLKLPGRTTKPLLRALAAKLLPAEITTAPKRGFEIPLQRWMQHDMNGLLREIVLDSGSYAMNRFDPDRLRALIDRPAHMDVKRWSAIAWMLLCLEFWHEGWRARQRSRYDLAIPAAQTAPAETRAAVA